MLFVFRLRDLALRALAVLGRWRPDPHESSLRLEVGAAGLPGAVAQSMFVRNFRAEPAGFAGAVEAAGAAAVVTVGAVAEVTAGMAGLGAPSFRRAVEGPAAVSCLGAAVAVELGLVALALALDVSIEPASCAWPFAAAVGAEVASFAAVASGVWLGSWGWALPRPGGACVTPVGAGPFPRPNAAIATTARAPAPTRPAIKPRFDLAAPGFVLRDTSAMGVGPVDAATAGGLLDAAVAGPVAARARFGSEEADARVEPEVELALEAELEGGADEPAALFDACASFRSPFAALPAALSSAGVITVGAERPFADSPGASSDQAIGVPPLVAVTALATGRGEPGGSGSVIGVSGGGGSLGSVTANDKLERPCWRPQEAIASW